MDDVLGKKIENRQHNIWTNEDLTKFGYVNYGISKSGKKIWVEKAYSHEKSKKQHQRVKNGLVVKCDIENGQTSWHKGMTRNEDKRIPIPWNKGLTKETDPRISDAWNKGKANIFSEETLGVMSRKRKGHRAWNKGLTKETDDRVKEAASHMKGHKGNSTSFKKGNIPWSKGKTGVYSEEQLEKMSSSRMGIPTGRSPMKGRKQTEEAKKKISLAHQNNPRMHKFPKGSIPWNKGLTKNDSKTLMKMSKGQTLNITKETLERMYFDERKSQESIAEELEIARWTVIRKMKEFDIPTRSPLATNRISSYERKIIRLCEEKNYPFKFVGRGGFRIDGKFPDFIATDGRKMIIETFSDFWHEADYEITRGLFLEEHGYKTLFLGDKDLFIRNWREICSSKIEFFIKEDKNEELVNGIIKYGGGYE